MPTFLALLRVVLALGMAFLVHAAPTSQAAFSASARYEREVISASNAERVSRSLTPVQRSACLQGYAEQQAKAMASRLRVEHQDMQAILSFCHLSEVGENVAFGYVGGAAVTTAWMKSASHHLNLVNEAHRLIGVGAAQDSDGHWYVSEVLGAAVPVPGQRS